MSGGFEEHKLIDSISLFVQVHGSSFLLLLSPFSGKKELEILSELQLRYTHLGHEVLLETLSHLPVNLLLLLWFRFLGSNLRVLPVRSSNEVVKGILTIAKVRAAQLSHLRGTRDQRLKLCLLRPPVNLTWTTSASACL